jgi:uncharacterized protein YecT (DUF1311 family)
MGFLRIFVTACLFFAAICVLTAESKAQPLNTGCEMAESWSGRIICEDKRLSQKSLVLDRIEADLLAIQAPEDKTGLQVEQAKWRFSLNSCKTVDEKDGISPADCMINMFDVRIAELDARLQEAMHGTAIDATGALTEHDMALQEVPVITAPENKPVTVTRGFQEIPGSDQAQKKNRRKPELIQFPKEPPVPDECTQAADKSYCLKKSKEDAEVELQLVASRLEMKLREIDVIKDFGSSETRFAETRKDFRRYRESHCRWASTVFGEENPDKYNSCFIKLTRERAQKLQELLGSF